MSTEQTLPPFQILAMAHGLFSDAEMDQLIAEHEPQLSEGKLGTGRDDAQMRRSQVVLMSPTDEYRWIYERLWEAAQALNQKYFCVDIAGVEGSVQIARYDNSDRGFYDWHTDFADLAPRRKISISVQLSRPEDYDGGDLELLFRSQPYQAERARGTCLAFPSFAVHRVTPVTRGTRWSLVAWIIGERWR